jgi:hypothetical protein
MKNKMSHLVAAFCLVASQQSMAADITLKEFINGFSNPFVDTPKFYAWQDEMTARLKTVFETCVPESARSRWKMVGDKPLMGDTGHFATATWSIMDKDTKKVEIFYVIFRNSGFDKDEKKFATIEQFVESIKTDSQDGWEEPYKWTVTKISDKEALLEGNLEGGKDRSLRRLILQGDWFVILKYETKYTKPDTADAWNEKKEIWQERLLKVNFN